MLALLGSVGMVLALAGCAPSHNWREVRHEGVPGVALFPCKPDRAVRDVAMMGPQSLAAPLHMMSCDVEGRTFVWAAWPLQAAEQGPVVMQAWQQASWTSLGQPQGPNLKVPEGWTASPLTQAGALSAVRWQGPAINHKGQTIEAQWLMLYTAEWAMQLAVYGPKASPELIEPFWTELKLPLAVQP
jgi:hypothetical protein